MNNSIQCNPNEIGCPFGRGEWSPEAECLYTEKCEQPTILYPAVAGVSEVQQPVQTIRSGGVDISITLITISVLIFSLIAAISTLISE